MDSVITYDKTAANKRAGVERVPQYAFWVLFGLWYSNWFSGELTSFSCVGWAEERNPTLL